MSGLKIALLGPSYPFKGGIAQYTTYLYRALARDHEVLFVSFRRQYPDWLYPGQTDRDDSALELFEPDALPLLDSLNPLTWWKTVREISRFRPQVVVFPWWVMYWAPQFLFMTLLLRLKSPQSRVIYLCHNVIAHEPSRLSRLLTRLTLRQGDAFIVQSAQDEEALRGMLADVEVKRIEHPAYVVPPERLWDGARARRELGLHGNVLLFFGYVRPYKGLDLLLQALPAVLARQDCTLVVAGELWGDSQHYLQLSERLGIADRVRWEMQYIPQERVPVYFGACDLVVLPYRSATGSGVVKLAHSHHRPVLVTDVGALPSAVRESCSGYIVPSGDPAALAAAILRHFSRDDREAMAAYIATHQEQCGWELLAQGVQQLYTAVGSGSR